MIGTSRPIPVLRMGDVGTYHIDGSIEAPEAGGEQIRGVSVLDHIHIRQVKICPASNEDDAGVVGIRGIGLMVDGGAVLLERVHGQDYSPHAAWVS